MHHKPIVTAAVAALLAGLAASPPARAADAGLESIWEGQIVYVPAHREMDMLVEIGRTPEGELAGTIDVPTMHMKFTPLQDIAIDGASVTFAFLKDSERLGPGARFYFEGKLSEDGREIHGEFVAGEVRKAFRLKRTAEAGTPRTPEVLSEVHPLAADGDELRAVFNRDAGAVRLLILLSPT